MTSAVLLGCLKFSLGSDYTKRQFMAFPDLSSFFPETFSRWLIQMLNEVIAGSLDAVGDLLCSTSITDRANGN